MSTSIGTKNGLKNGLSRDHNRSTSFSEASTASSPPSSLMDNSSGLWDVSQEWILIFDNLLKHPRGRAKGCKCDMCVVEYGVKSSSTFSGLEPNSIGGVNKKTARANSTPVTPSADHFRWSPNNSSSSFNNGASAASVSPPGIGMVGII